MIGKSKDRISEESQANLVTYLVLKYFLHFLSKTVSLFFS